MSTIINASTSGIGGALITPDNSGILELQTAGVAAITIDDNQNVELANPLPVSAGGTGLSSPGANGYVLTSNGTEWVSAPTSSLLPVPGTVGNVLTSDGSEWVSSPLPSELPAAGNAGNVLYDDGSEWVSGTVQDVLPTPGANGQVLTVVNGEWSSSAIPSQLPSPSIANYILKSNGSAWVAAPQQSVLPSPTTVGNVLMADGTNWVSRNPYYFFPPGGWYIYTLNNHRIGDLYSAIVNGYEVRKCLGVGPIVDSDTIYEFEAVFNFKSDHFGSNKTRSRDFYLGFGGSATVNNISYQVKYTESDTIDVEIDDDVVLAGDSRTATVQTTELTEILTMTTAGNRNAHIGISVRGVVSINDSGTFIPLWKNRLQNGGFWKTRKGSYFRIRPLGPAGGDAAVGNWE